jgi:ElaB/YqjD/DUF883 family membrane-anchored ribosome-binding protein
MDNQKPNEGSARDTGRESSGTSMGKDQPGRGEVKGGSAGSAGSAGASGGSSGGTGGSIGGTGAATSTTTGAVGGTSNAGATGGSSAAGSSGSMGGNASGMGSDKLTSDTGKGMSSLRPEEMHKTIDKAAQAAQPVVDRLANTAHAGVDRVTGMFSGASHSMGERQQQLSEAYGQMMESSREYIRQKPATAMMMAVGAGFLLAKLFGNNRRDY